MDDDSRQRRRRWTAVVVTTTTTIRWPACSLVFLYNKKNVLETFINLPIFKNVKYVSLIVDGDEQTPRSSVNETESLARQAHCWGVYDWQVLFNILGE